MGLVFIEKTLSILDILFLLFAHVSIWPTPPTHLVSKHQHLATPPTHIYADVILEWSLSRRVHYIYAAAKYILAETFQN